MFYILQVFVIFIKAWQKDSKSMERYSFSPSTLDSRPEIDLMCWILKSNTTVFFNASTAKSKDLFMISET